MIIVNVSRCVAAVISITCISILKWTMVSGRTRRSATCHMDKGNGSLNFHCSIFILFNHSDCHPASILRKPPESSYDKHVSTYTASSYATHFDLFECYKERNSQSFNAVSLDVVVQGFLISSYAIFQMLGKKHRGPLLLMSFDDLVQGSLNCFMRHLCAYLH